MDLEDAVNITSVSALNFSVTDVSAVTSEPGTWVLLAMGLGVVVVMRRRLCWQMHCCR
jgi:hypothetical protein